MELHSAGATVRHVSPFAERKSYVNAKEITQEFRNEWVIPYYLNLNNNSAEWIHRMINLKSKITEDVILQNLGDFNWRTRSVGSYFAAIMESKHLEGIIGTHLLKSEVCRSGSQYAFTLASFNTTKSVAYLNDYLSYYLNTPQLYFDQKSVLTALKYLDAINGTSYVKDHIKNYESLVAWQYQDGIKRMKDSKKLVPEKADEIDRMIEDMEPETTVLDTSSYDKSMKLLHRIIKG